MCIVFNYIGVILKVSKAAVYKSNSVNIQSHMLNNRTRLTRPMCLILTEKRVLYY